MDTSKRDPEDVIFVAIQEALDALTNYHALIFVTPHEMVYMVYWEHPKQLYRVRVVVEKRTTTT